MTDLILVGGGLANTLIALRLAEAQPELDVLVLEQGPRAGGNHTWSFHGSDVTPAQLRWLEPLIVKNWTGYDVRFPNFQRTLPGTYHSISSDRLAELAAQRLGTSLRCDTDVATVEPNAVTLADGTRMTARAVVDGRGPEPSEHLTIRFQKFVGQLVTLEAPHGLERPVIMDATMRQDEGYRFFYLLPFSERTILLEDTRYSDNPNVESSNYGREIDTYARRQGWRIASVEREEFGVLPITLYGDIEAYWDSAPARVARSGLRAALFHPGTGYSLPNALSLADQLAQQEDWSPAAVYATTRAASVDLWQRSAYYRSLNRLLFIAAEPAQRYLVLKRFYHLRASLISRFYAGTSTRFDKLRTLVGKPPLSMYRAFSTLWQYRGQ